MMTDTDDEKPNLSSSLTSMDWLQLLNSENTVENTVPSDHVHTLTEITYCRPPYRFVFKPNLT